MASTAPQQQQQKQGSDGSSGSVSKPEMRKPVFVKVGQLSPGTSGHTLTVKVVSSNPILQKKSRNPQLLSRGGGGTGQSRIAECLVGDETGTIFFTARNDQGDATRQRTWNKTTRSVVCTSAELDNFPLCPGRSEKGKQALEMADSTFDLKDYTADDLEVEVFPKSQEAVEGAEARAFETREGGKLKKSPKKRKMVYVAETEVAVGTEGIPWHPSFSYEADGVEREITEDENFRSNPFIVHTLASAVTLPRELRLTDKADTPSLVLNMMRDAMKALLLREEKREEADGVAAREMEALKFEKTGLESQLAESRAAEVRLKLELDAAKTEGLKEGLKTATSFYDKQIPVIRVKAFNTGLRAAGVLEGDSRYKEVPVEASSEPVSQVDSKTSGARHVTGIMH